MSDCQCLITSSYLGYNTEFRAILEVSEIGFWEIAKRNFRVVAVWPDFFKSSGHTVVFAVEILN